MHAFYGNWYIQEPMSTHRLLVYFGLKNWLIGRGLGLHTPTTTGEVTGAEGGLGNNWIIFLQQFSFFHVPKLKTISVTLPNRKSIFSLPRN